MTELAVAFTVLIYLIQECGKQLLSHPAHLTQNQNSPVNFTNTSLLHQLNEGPSTNGLLILPLLQAASFFQMHKNLPFLFIQKQVAWRKFTYQNLIGDSKACTSYTTGPTIHREEKTEDLLKFTRIILYCLCTDREKHHKFKPKSQHA